MTLTVRTGCENRMPIKNPKPGKILLAGARINVTLGD
jgi:hypothetical protein